MQRRRSTAVAALIRLILWVTVRDHVDFLQLYSPPFGYADNPRFLARPD